MIVKVHLAFERWANVSEKLYKLSRSSGHQDEKIVLDGMKGYH